MYETTTNAEGASGRMWLDVPFAEKDEAKAAGAWWDPQARRWYAPRAIAALEKWRARPDLPSLLPGEDRTYGQGLFVDLVPSSCWFTNVRSCISPTDWDRVRRMVYTRANNRCEACGRAPERELLARGGSWCPCACPCVGVYCLKQ